MSEVLKLINSADLGGLNDLLMRQPELANAGVPLAVDDLRMAHPLHRICDGVISGRYSDETGVEIAKVFLSRGADVNGATLTYLHDTPLMAASSLLCDQVALFYIERGADLNHIGGGGATALHWAAWCGRDVVVERLIEAGADTTLRCIDHLATPLFWAAHGLRHGGASNQYHQIACMNLLLKTGADRKVPNASGKTIDDLLTDEEKAELYKD